MVSIFINRRVYENIATIVGNDPVVISNVLTDNFDMRVHDYGRVSPIAKRVVDNVTKKVEEHLGLEPGFTYECHENGKLRRDSDRPMYRYLILLIAVYKFRVRQSHATAALGLHHAMYNHASKAIGEMCWSSSLWKEQVQQIELLYNIKIL